MNLLIFVFVFFLAAVFFMPLIGFCYKICETAYKRSLFAKGAKQIQLFSACLLLLCAAALGADYFFKGNLFQANLLIQKNASFGIWQNSFIFLTGGSFLTAFLCFLAYKFSKKQFFFALSAAAGIFLAACMGKFLSLIAASGITAENSSIFVQYCQQIFNPVFALPAETFTENPYAVFASSGLFSALFLCFVLIAVFLYALYFVCILSFLFRNAMDYGRDYYTFMLAKYGRALFLVSLTAAVLGFMLLAGFALPFQNKTAEILSAYSAQPQYLQWALLAVPLVCSLISLKLKKSFYAAQIPMQKKSNVIIAVLLDFAFAVCIFFCVMNCTKF